MDMLGTWDGRCGHSKPWPGRSGSSFLGATWPMLYSGIWWCMLLGAQQSRAFGTTRDTFRTAHVCIGICWTSTSWNTRIQAAILSNIYIYSYIYIYIHTHVFGMIAVHYGKSCQPTSRKGRHFGFEDCSHVIDSCQVPHLVQCQPMLSRVEHSCRSCNSSTSQKQPLSVTVTVYVICLFPFIYLSQILWIAVLVMCMYM